MNRIVAVVLAVALAGLGGCSTPALQRRPAADPIDAPYQLASGDRLRVIVFGQDNLSNSFSVDGAGNVAMPLIGLVHAQGLTTAQFGQALSRASCARASCATRAFPWKSRRIGRFSSSAK